MERRIDPKDKLAYIFDQFKQLYGPKALDIWNESPIALVPAGPPICHENILLELLNK